MKRFLGVATVIGICALALTAYAGNLNTSGKCPNAAACSLGLANTTTFTITTDGAGDAEVALSENSIGPDELAVITMTVDLCGQNDENGTVYFGPHLTDNWLENEDDITDGSIGGSICDGLDNGTEGTADAPLTGVLAYKVLGMYCFTDGTLAAGETLVFTARSAAADLTPSVTCSLAVGETSCVSVTGSTTDIADGATIAVKAVQVSNNSDDNSWCRVFISPKAGAS
jgi:hypothetical protein